MYASQIENHIKNIQWWEEKNKYKETDVEYPIDFEIQMVEHIKQGDILEVSDD